MVEFITTEFVIVEFNMVSFSVVEAVITEELGTPKMLFHKLLKGLELWAPTIIGAPSKVASTMSNPMPRSEKI